jgi:hypothetical protein
MNAPVWYLIARIDLTGGSTGNFRAELITQALAHLDEWWLVGTDYTRHWMPTGVDWSPYHTDITNYYIKMGVIGGLPLLILFVAILVTAFNLLGRTMTAIRGLDERGERIMWLLGGTLFAHTATFISVTYFDQSYVMFCVLIGILPAITMSEINLTAQRPIPRTVTLANQSSATIEIKADPGP